LASFKLPDDPYSNFQETIEQSRVQQSQEKSVPEFIQPPPPPPPPRQASNTAPDPVLLKEPKVPIRADTIKEPETLHPTKTKPKVKATVSSACF